MSAKEPDADATMFHNSADYFAESAVLATQLINFANSMKTDNPIMVLTALKTAAAMYENGLSGEVVRITLANMFATRTVRTKPPPDGRMN